MANHRAVSARRRRPLVTAGGMLAGGVMLVATSGVALADVSPGEYTGNRPNFENPAPVVRMAQQVGDSTFDANGSDGPIVAGIRAQVDAGPVGSTYHNLFGYSEIPGENEGDPPIRPGSNGTIVGVLNGTGPVTRLPGVVYANTVNIHECQMKWSPGWDGFDGGFGPGNSTPSDCT